MSLQVEKMEKNMAKLTIEVSAEEFEKAVQNAYLRSRGKITIPGFRKGKAPRVMIEKMYGAGIFFEDAANALIQAEYPKAADESGLEIVSQPEIDVVQIEKGKSFIFTADVATKPEVKLGEYKGLEVDKVSTRVTQKEVDAKIQEEAEKNAREVVVTDRPVADGDEVILDFEGFVDGEAFEGGKGENYPLTIGSGSFIPGFEEQLVGAEAEKEVEVKVTFPEDYHAEELKGKEAVFKCTVHEIKAKELPEIDDEFAAEVSEFDTLEEYKADVKAKIKEQKAADGKRNQEDQAVEQAVANLVAMRETEGGNIYGDFIYRADLIAEKLAQIEERSPLVVEEYQAKLQERLTNLLADNNIKVEPERLLQEVAIFADRTSITEEIVRLKSHIKQFKTIIASDQPVGRKLDFLIQEFNREANTIASKANDYTMAQIVVEIKAEIEKIREQIQNIE